MLERSVLKIIRLYPLENKYDIRSFKACFPKPWFCRFKTQILIPLGSISGNEVLSNLGPKIPIQINPTGVVTTEFRSEFEAAGINQTLHRIYLYTVCRINIITPYRILSNEVSSEVIVAESIIVGPVPDSYYNLEGLQRNDAMEVID